MSEEKKSYSREEIEKITEEVQVLVQKKRGANDKLRVKESVTVILNPGTDHAKVIEAGDN